MYRGVERSSGVGVGRWGVGRWARGVLRIHLKVPAGDPVYLQRSGLYSAALGAGQSCPARLEGTLDRNHDSVHKVHFIQFLGLSRGQPSN